MKYNYVSTKHNELKADKGSAHEDYVRGTVVSMNHKGECVVSIAHEDKEISYTLDGVYVGDEVLLQKGTSKRKMRRKQARVHAITQSAYARLTPLCQHYGVCGGCSMQELSYHDQCAIKLRYVQGLLLPHLSSLSEEEKRGKPLLSHDTHWYYRNRVDYTFGAKRWLTKEERDLQDGDRRGLGFHVKGFYDRVVHVSHCMIHESNAIRNAVHQWAFDRTLTYYNSRTHQGWLRGLTIRNSLSGEYMVIIVAHEYRKEPLEELTELLVSTFPQIRSFLFIENNGLNDVILNLPHKILHGNDFIFEQCGHINIKIYPQVFYQTNSYMAPLLYQEIVTMAELQSDMRVLDLYCGIGSIGLYIATHVAQVLGIELVEDSVQAARENAQLNGITNIDFTVGAVEDVVYREEVKAQTFDTIIVDPPRAGLHPRAIAFLRTHKAKKVVYVSCNPTTLVRDLDMLADEYRVVKWRAVDMFPHTFHVETIVLIESI